MRKYAYYLLLCEKKLWMIVTVLDRVNSLKHYATCFVLLNVTDSLQSEKTIGLSLKGILCKFYVN